jgi:tRNA (guanine-N(7)-)-methyltransferase subunit TRM82
MSKQLLHSFQSHVVVAALSDRAFAVVTSKNDTSSVAQVFELLPPSQPPKNKAAVNEKVDVKSEDDINEPKSSPTSSDTKDEIQAVCCTEIASHIWLAVSREDKTLSMYCINTTSQEKGVHGKEEAMELKPLAVYNMPKRARCLVFSAISSSGANEDCNVIIAGDLSGDSYAYPIPSNCASSNNETATMKSASRRLLLGHTASILTGMQVSPSSKKNQQFILTADRDEKVRVSHFPEAHIIHGYLLGHSAFISAMDAVTAVTKDDGVNEDRRTLCLTASGDGTVRLWDYELCKEVGMVPVVLKESAKDNNDEVKDDSVAETNDVKKESNNEENDDESVDFDSDDFEEDYDGLIAVPLAVAISSDSKFAIVARDGVSSIDIHPIPPPAQKTSTFSSLALSHLVSLHKKQTLACPSQPLDICLLSDGSVLVLTREPEYLLHFKCKDSNLQYDDVTTSSSFCGALKQIAISQVTSMPMTTLEYNEDGSLKLQKKIDLKELESDGEDAAEGTNDGSKAGADWNNAERRDTYRKANQRRRKRKLEEGAKGEV